MCYAFLLFPREGEEESHPQRSSGVVNFFRPHSTPFDGRKEKKIW
jgi:hypothetical protein